MSDQKLRELERRWKETGSPDDEAAYLLERVRVGDLSRERLELAAYCGHEGAMLASGTPEAPDDPDPMAWALKLGRWEGASELAALESAQLAAVNVDLDDTYPGSGPVILALEAARRALHFPCPEHRQAAMEAAQALPRGFMPEADTNARFAARFAAIAAAGMDPEGSQQALFHARVAMKNDIMLSTTLRTALTSWALTPIGQ